MKNNYIISTNLVIESFLVIEPVILTSLEQGFSLLQERLQAFASTPDFNQKMTLAFGERIDIEALNTAWLAGDVSIVSGIEILDPAAINGANGAYAAATDRIYLSSEFLINNQANSEALVGLLLEEIGHRVDTRLNETDTRGDEGAIFSALVLGESLSSEVLASLQTEDDSGTIILNGQVIGVENQTFNSVANSVPIYFNNFDTSAGTEWSNRTIGTTPIGGRKFLGQFGNGTVSLTLNDNRLTNNLVSLEFDLFVINSWDGNVSGVGPDLFNLSIAGGQTLLNTTFSNTEEVGYRQSYPGEFGTGNNPGGTGATEIDTLGYSFYGNSVYHLAYTFPYSTNSLSINFTGSNLQGISDESWGLDNVSVSILPVILLSDNFNGENNGGGRLNYTGLANWTVSDGSVDLIGSGYFDLLPGNGFYLDLDGSTSNAGRLESKTTFNFNAGDKVTLNFSLAGSQRGDTNSVTVSLGNLFSETFTLNTSQPLNQFTRTFTVTSPASAKLIFDHVGGDNFGLLLDNVELSKTANNSFAPGILSFSQPNFSVNEDGTHIVAVTVTRTGGSDGNVSATINLTNGTSTAESDYNNAPITVNFANGETSKAVNIPIVNDTQFEPDETINLTLNNPTGGATLGTQKTAVLQIMDNDASKYAIKFNGINQQADLGTWFNYQNFTLEMWVKAGETQVRYADIIDNNHRSNRSWVVQQNDYATNNYHFGVSSSTGVGTGVSFALTPNTWQHLAFVKDVNSVSVYIDGVLVNSASYSGSINYDGSQFLRLANWGVGGRNWNGSMDEVRIWNTARTASEIVNNFNQSVAPNSTGLVAYYQFNERTGSTSADATINGRTASLINNPVWVAENPVGILSFSQPNFSINEDGTPVTTVTVNRTGISTGSVSATVNLTNGTATAPSDYNIAPITVNFANGETSKTVTIPIVNETQFEPDETINLTLTNPQGGATFGTQTTAVLTIINDDAPQPGTVSFNTANYTVNENGTANINLIRTGGSDGEISVTITPADGTATAVSDYNNSPITVTFANGETSKTVTIPLTDDSIYEPNETVNLTLNNPTGGATLGTQSTAILNIIDNDAVPGVIQFSNATYSINENGTSVTAVTLTRNNGSDGNVSARINLSNGTATAPSDYNNTPITVNFANGETSKTVTIPIVNDTKFEADETINLTLTNPLGGATLGTQTTAQLTIINDDAPQPGTVSFNAANYTVNENGTANINLIRNGGSDGEISVTVTPTDGIATAVSDYNNSPITVTFANGETSKTVTIPLTDDNIYEPNETVNLTLNNPTGGANLGTQNTAILNIIDNDAVPGVIEFSNATYSINENGTPVTAVTLTRTNGTDGNVSARINLSNGTATAGSDYNNSSITVNFANGETSKTVTIPIIDDSQFEPEETINLTLSNPSNGATIGTQNSAIVNIIDNDFKPTLTVNITAEQATEGNTIQGTVTRNTDTTEPLTVTLVNSDNTQITAPTTVTIPVGANSVNFSITAVDDNLIELPKNYSIIASAQGFVSGSDSIAVIDNDAITLTLTVDTTNINENGGKAIATVTRNIITDIPLVVQLSSNDTTEATVPATVTIAGNQALATFEIQGVDDTILDGTQAVIITAKPVYTNINVALQTGNAVANLNVVDNESPSLKLTIDRDVISETGTATATITRNTNTDSELVVSLNSSDTTEATVPNTVTIAAGQTSATFAITGVSDGINDGSQTVIITASATELNSGTDSLEVTDINVPDLTVTNLQGIQPTYTGKQSQFTYTVANNGIINASGSWKDRVYLSVDNKLDANDTLLGEFALGSAENPANFAPGTSYERNVTYFAPRTPGQYYLIASADTGNTVNEGVGVGENNNTTITPLTVTPAYRAIVSTDTETALTGNSVVLRGQAISNVDNSPVAFEFVKVRVENKGTIREFDSFTNANGKFVRQFTPLPGEGGTYNINAYFPGNAAEDTAPEDEFTVLGMRFEQNDQSLQQVSRTIVEGTTVNGSVKLQNLSDIDLSGLTANVNGAPSNWTVEVTPEKSNLAGDEEIRFLRT
ncbi:MAG: Calx-beta domain-containing protein [Gloeotrichia echinulata DVL01]|jgi:hypothetical protein